MKYLLIKSIFFSIIFIFYSCGNPKEKEPYNLYGNSHRTSSYENLGRFWTGISSLEDAGCSDSSGFTTFPLALSENKFVTATNNGLVVLFQHTRLQWEFKLGTGEFLVSNLVASPKEDILFISNKNFLYSISNSGTLNWKANLSDTSSVYSTLLATKEAVYFASPKYLYKYNYQGKLLWSLPLFLETTMTFAEFSNDKLVMNLTFNEVNRTDTILLISSKGKILWSRPLENVRLLRSPVVWKDKIFAFGYGIENSSQVGYLFCIDSAGTIQWKKEFDIVPRYLSITVDGTLFLCLYNSGLGETISTIYKLDNHGNILSQQHISAIFYSPLFISQQILCAVGYTRGNPSLIFLDSELNLWKTFDLTKFPTLLNIPAFLTDCSLIFVSAVSNHLVRIDENPIIKLLPW